MRIRRGPIFSQKAFWEHEGMGKGPALGTLTDILLYPRIALKDVSRVFLFEVISGTPCSLVSDSDSKASCLYPRIRV